MRLHGKPMDPASGYPWLGTVKLLKDSRVSTTKTGRKQWRGFGAFESTGKREGGNNVTVGMSTGLNFDLADKLIEVIDLDSDMLVYDIRNNCLISSESIKKKDVWETFPAFSADGRTLYFCAASPKPIPAEVDQIRYNLCSVDFDPATGTIGSRIDTLVFAEGAGKSVSFPKPSYDGKFLVYTLSDYGNFSIWHHEADLWIMDLETGESRPMDKINSHDTESYHSWSSNSRWMMFSSRRDDGLYTRLFFTHIDENGQESKPFMLPQKHPLHYYSYQNRSYNVPEFVTGPVDLDRTDAEKMINSEERIQFGFRMSE